MAYVNSSQNKALWVVEFEFSTDLRIKKGRKARVAEDAEEEKLQRLQMVLNQFQLNLW